MIDILSPKMEEQACPRCKTTKYRNPNLKFMVNVCGHSLCENCVEILFVRGSGACPQCNTALRRNNFRLQLFEDARVEKEVDIRKKILRDFNKKEDDFVNLNEYNDYLEMVETIVFNLANDIDVEDTKQMIEGYKKENAEQIKKNKSKKSREEEMLEEMIELEKSHLEEARKLVQQEELKAQTEKKKDKEALIDQLSLSCLMQPCHQAAMDSVGKDWIHPPKMFSDVSANEILAAHQREQAMKQEALAARPPPQPRHTFSTGIRVGRKEGFMPARSRQAEVQLYSYEAPTLLQYGPNVPPTPALAQRHMNYVRETSEAEKGGGFTKAMACKRALQEAFCGLFFDTETLHISTSAVGFT